MYNYTIDKENLSIFKNYIKSRLLNKKRVNLFCSITYITTNYTVLITLTTLAQLIKEGYHLHLVLWDFNSLANPYFKRLFLSETMDISQSKFIESRKRNLAKILISLGAKEDSFTVYKASDLWKRVVTIQSPDLFLCYYKILAQLSPEKLLLKNKASHLIQMSADVFMGNYLHLFYPEEISKPIDAFVVTDRKYYIYEETKRIMKKEGFIGEKTPLFITIKNMPYIIKDENVPEWSMDLEESEKTIYNYSPSISLTYPFVTMLFSERCKTVFIVSLSFFCASSGLSEISSSSTKVPKFSIVSRLRVISSYL